MSNSWNHQNFWSLFEFVLGAYKLKRGLSRNYSKNYRNTSHKIFGQKLDFVLGEHDMTGGRPPTNF